MSAWKGLAKDFIVAAVVYVRLHIRKTGYKVALNFYLQRASQLPELFDNLDAVSGHKWVK